MSPASSLPPAAPTTSPPFALAETVVNSGAILTLPGTPLRHHLVGYFTWLGANRLFWFTAHGDQLDDGRSLEFDDAQAAPGDTILFYRAGQLAATLAPIPAAGVEDPDDYLIAWQLWHGVSPRRGALIRASLARFVDPENEGPAISVDANVGRPTPVAARRSATR